MDLLLTDHDKTLVKVKRAHCAWSTVNTLFSSLQLTVLSGSEVVPSCCQGPLVPSSHVNPCPLAVDFPNLTYIEEIGREKGEREGMHYILGKKIN